MSKLGGLIQGQDVSFDTHQSAQQSIQPEDLHLEKRLHKGGKIRFPMFGTRSPSASGVNDDTYSRVTKEVTRTLRKDDELTKDLARTVASELQRFRSYQATKSEAQEAARKIAGYFDLDKFFVDSVVRYSGEILQEFVSVHRSSLTEEIKEVRLSAKAVVVRDARHYYRAKYRRE